MWNSYLSNLRNRVPETNIFQSKQKFIYSTEELSDSSIKTSTGSQLSKTCIQTHLNFCQHHPNVIALKKISTVGPTSPEGISLIRTSTYILALGQVSIRLE